MASIQFQELHNDACGLFELLISESDSRVITLNVFFTALNYQGRYMETNINLSVIGAVLILMAAASLFTMLSLNQINYIVHGDLYSYGLQFSYRWAMPYWVFSGIVFGLSWVNIFLSIIITLYIFKKTRKPALDSKNISQTEKIEAAARFKEEKEQRKLSEYVGPQKEELTMPKEETEEMPSEEFIEEKVAQAEETMETVEAQETQINQQETKEEIEPSEETEEAPVPTEDIEQRQSIL